MGEGLKVAVLPEAEDWLAAAIRAGGAQTASVEDAEALVWDAGSPGDLERVLVDAGHLRWVQLSWTGVDRYLPLMGDGRVWTCARDVYGPGVAEHALALALAVLKGVTRTAREAAWTKYVPRTLFGARVVVIGGGSIGRAIGDLLRPFDCTVSVITRRNRHQLLDSLRGVDAVFLAVPLTSETDGMIGERELRAMGDRAVLVNVARGRLVKTDDLVRALTEDLIAGAGLDVTEPEPLPDGHPLWQLPNCVITPHIASVDSMAREPYSRLVTENVRRFAAREPLLGIVDPERGY
jgi:phosphoglycerate dehydrogenase-like enzyme